MSYKPQLFYLVNPRLSPPEDLKYAIDSYTDYWLSMHSYVEPLGFYHYTSIEGLKGILNSRSIWFTNSSTLNDPLEIQYGKKIILDKLNYFFEKEKSNEIKNLLKTIITLIKSFGQHLFYAYIAAFCEKDNLLSQWRSYADKGGGYNLGFFFDSETKFTRNSDDLSNNINVALRKVVYNQEKQVDIVEKLILSIVEGANTVLKKVANQRNKINEDWEYHTALDVVNLFFDIILSFKNPVFEEEKEWRLIQVLSPQHQPELLKFRESVYGLVPYIDTYIYKNVKEFAEFPLRSLRFGPILEEVRTKTAITLLLNNQASLPNRIKLNSSTRVFTSYHYLKNT